LLVRLRRDGHGWVDDWHYGMSRRGLVERGRWTAVYGANLLTGFGLGISSATCAYAESLDGTKGLEVVSPRASPISDWRDRARPFALVSYEAKLTLG